jgi:oxygen-independent coproporphyrinogen III oxidase
MAGRPLDTIYFGGGTPSLLSPNQIDVLLREINSHFQPREPMEITLECNPLATEMERLEGFREAGVNRISLGVQSFNPLMLNALGRRHTADEARQAIQNVTRLGFRSWGLDLIFALPGQTLGDWESDLREAISFHPPHISVYGLTLHEGTPMYAQHERGALHLPADETQRDMFFIARRILTEAGWRHYEISNYAIPGHESRHNSAYWTGGEYLGLGPAAHSYFMGQRWSNPTSLDDYLRAVDSTLYPAVMEPYSSLGAMRGERIMLALRQCDGFNPTEMSRAIGCDFMRQYGPVIRALQKRGLLSVDETNVRLTEEGLILSDQVFVEFF